MESGKVEAASRTCGSTAKKRRRSKGTGESSSSPRPVEKRTSKACDICRLRRTKCSGSTPCEACVANGTEAECRYRNQARPNRAKPYLLAAPRASTDTAQDKPKRPGLDSHGPGSGTGKYISPVTIVEEEITSWQASQYASTSRLTLSDWTWVNRPIHQPLANRPLNPVSEEALIVHFSQTFSEHFHYLDSAELLNIHARFRLAPLSVTSDLVALLRACLCAASSSLGSSETPMSGGSPEVERARLNDALGYYKLGKDDIRNWNKPSIPALWALHFLIGYVMGEGSYEETRPLVKQMCDWALEMRLDHKDTAGLYPDKDGVHQLFLTCFYFDCLIAGIGSSPPCLSWGTFELDTSSIGSHPATTIQVAVFESELLAMYTRGRTPTVEEALELEAKWNPHMRTIRTLSNTLNVEENALAYANIRFSWLSIMLRVPFLQHPTFGPSSLSTIARAAGHILLIYSRMASVSRYLPAWPQLHRIVTCGQILIVNWIKGDGLFSETKHLFEVFQGLLKLHVEKWPALEELERGFSAMATMYGWATITLPSDEVNPSVYNGLPMDLKTWDEWFSVLADDFTSA